MDNKKVTQANAPTTVKAGGRTLDDAYGFSFAIALGLILFIGGLVVSLTMGMGSGVGLVFGIPLLIAGLLVPIFMTRDIFTRHEVTEPCPYCGTIIKTTDAMSRLECPKCHKMVLVREAHYHKTEQ